MPGIASAQQLGANGELSAEGAVVEGAGIRAGESLYIHPTVGLETGFISNVFYEDADEKPAGILRVLAELHVQTQNEKRLAAQSSDDGGELSSEPERGDFHLRAGIRFAYEEYLSGNDAVQAQRDLGIEANIRGLVFPEGTWVFAFADEFQRLVRPTNFESSDNIDRDVNYLRLFLRYQPGGRALTGTLRYENRIDFFEDEDHEFANRLQHTFGLRLAWNWLPVTQFYFDGSIGIFTGLGDGSRKVDSYPLRLVLGTSTAITTSTTLNLQVGYGQGFYADGPDFQNVVFGSEFGWRYSPLGRLTLLYRYDFQDSINANYYRDHQIRAGIEQQIVQFTVTAGVDVRFRHYDGIDPMFNPSTPDRDDVIVSAELGGQYHFRDWLAATVDYRLVSDETDFRYMPDETIDDPSYVRHELYAGLLAAF